jgi:hypothetical protein
MGKAGAGTGSTGKKKRGSGRRLKKQARRTLGALFLASAIVVAALPVNELEAATEEPEITVTARDTGIPVIEPSEPIYTTGDGRFQFAYVAPDGYGNKVAVVLGYNKGYLEGNSLVIPDTVDAYSKYSDNLGSNEGYVAVGKSGNFLFYKVEERVGEEEKTVPRYYPCYFADRSKWQQLALNEFYYVPDGDPLSVTSGDADKFAQTQTDSVQWIKAADVAYIGNQYLTSKEGGGAWEISSDNNNSTITLPEQGIFANASNVVNLTIGQTLRGIGNYAFYGCTGLGNNPDARVSLGNGLNTIGNYAFANCINMKNIELPPYTNLTMIGDHAFYQCQALTAFTMLIAVQKVGDSAFEGCSALQEIILDGSSMSSDTNVALTDLGRTVFRNCTSLRYLKLPATYSQTEPFSLVQGCTSLEYVSLPNSAADLKSDDEFTLDNFKATVPSSFYLEGQAASAIYRTASANAIAFHYLDLNGAKDVYEIVISDTVSGKKATYRVNSQNQLTYCELEQGIANVEIPGTIGPYQITEIGETSFQNNCFLEKITIPSSITKIAASAFQGSHNLRDVIFEEPVNLTEIGENAFQTQKVAYHQSNCPDYSGVSVPTDSKLALEPALTFTGPIGYDSVPFVYAMDPAHNINVGEQYDSYIRYYSGWPENLEVSYNPDTDRNELTDYPTFASLDKLTVEDYPYMTKAYAEAAKSAAQKYQAGTTLTADEKAIVDAALNIDLPEGIEGIQAGLFREKEPEDKGVEKTITTNGIREIEAESFRDCTNLTAIFIKGDMTAIGDYAFRDCTNLRTATISPTVSSLGLRPFAGCTGLTEVDFGGGSYFTYDKGILYGLTDGERSLLVECLEGRGDVVGASAIKADELAGIREIAEEAFLDCGEVGTVDLSLTTIPKVPRSAFESTSELNEVTLPTTCRSIDAYAFRYSNLRTITIPSSVSLIDLNAFDTKKGAVINNEKDHYKQMTFLCAPGSAAAVYAAQYDNITAEEKAEPVVYEVAFWGDGPTLLKEEPVESGRDATPPEPEEIPAKAGHTFSGWAPDYHEVGKDLNVVAQYTPDVPMYTVTFLDWDDTLLIERKVAPGDNADPPGNPEREGYMFTGWRPSFENIRSDTVLYAQYEKAEIVARFLDYDDKVLYTQKVGYGETPVEPKDPTRQGYTFTGWKPTIGKITKSTDYYATYDSGSGGNGSGGNGNGGDGNGGDGSGGGTAKFYTLTVHNGSGSGSYVAGASVIVIANDPAAGQSFDQWSIDPASTFLASKRVTATVLTMPEAAVTVTAHYTGNTGSSNTGSSNTGSSSTSTGSGSTSSSQSGGASGGGSTGTVTKPETGSGGSTTVVIDKNGLSNTGVVSAVVNGSSDDFVIRITDSVSSTEQIVKALMNEYGDLTNIKYFPMDISLYDTTGNTSITDTTGLSIRITLPLPDSLIPYAGNNKVAGVVDERLDKLTPKFTTISGVPCITFTAEHFSPYVIYVDTTNLAAGGAADDTPRTGDGIHPKWFLSIGLACVSMVLFLKQDKRKRKPGTAAA